MSDDLCSLLQHLGSQWSTVDILGWSMGGHILQRLLTREEDTSVGNKGQIQIGKGKISVRKAILAATMTKLPRGDIDMNKMQQE